MTDIVDEIDALVDWQLDQYSDRSGYDHNVRQAKCWHCGRDWHGLAITERMNEMRISGQVSPGYSYAEDDSHVVCPGSNFIGPMPPTRSMWLLPDPMYPPEYQFPRPTTARCGCVGCRMFERLRQQMRATGADPYSYSGYTVTREVFGDSGRAFERWLNGEPMSEEMAPSEESVVTPPAPPQRALPRPSTTPPMWAVNPSRTRRTRNGARDVRTPLA